MIALRTWWQGITARERLLVSIMLALLLIVGGWLGLWRPLARLHDDALARRATAEAALADVLGMAARIRAIPPRADPAMPLSAFVRQRADAAGLSVARLDDTGPASIGLHIAAVRSPALLRWLAALETSDGLVIDQLAVTRNDDASLAVDLVIRRPGA